MIEISIRAGSREGSLTPEGLRTPLRAPPIILPLAFHIRREHSVVLWAMDEGAAPAMRLARPGPHIVLADAHPITS